MQEPLGNREIYGALAGSIAIIVGLVGVLYNRLNADIRGHEERLNSGGQAFADVGKELVSIGERLAAMQAVDRHGEAETALLQRDIQNLHSRLLTIEVEHKHRPGCQ